MTMATVKIRSYYRTGRSPVNRANNFNYVSNNYIAFFNLYSNTGILTYDFHADIIQDLYLLSNYYQLYLNGIITKELFIQLYKESMKKYRRLKFVMRFDDKESMINRELTFRITRFKRAFYSMANEYNKQYYKNKKLYLIVDRLIKKHYLLCGRKDKT